MLWDADGRRHPWTVPVTFGTGPGVNWHGVPIWADTASSTEGNAVGWALLRCEVALPNKPVLWATLHATASSTRPARQFVYRLWVDGRQLGVGPVFPIGGETRYDGYDVSSLLCDGGRHAIGGVAYTMEDRRFAAQLDVAFVDGEMRHYATDRSWQALTADGIYSPSDSIGTQYFAAPAEDCDIAYFPEGFSSVGYDDADWGPARPRPAFTDMCACPADPMRPCAVKYDAIRCTSERYVIVDFTRTVMGGIRIDADVEAPMTLTIRCGEVMDGADVVRYRLSAGNVYEDHWRFPSSAHAMQHWGIRVFRYAQVIVDGLSAADVAQLLESGALRIHAVALERHMLRDRATMSSDNAVLNAVWRLCDNTIRALNANIYVDSWTRERAPYEADAWIQQRAHLALEYAPSLGEYSVDWLLANRTWPTEWPLYVIVAVHDAWLHTGSTRQAAERYDALRLLLPDAYLDDASGLIVKDPGESSRMDGYLVDWPQSERDGFVFGSVNTVVNALASQAYADMGDLAQALGRFDDASRWCATARRMREAIHHRLYDPERGAYVDGLRCGPDDVRIDHCSLHASAFVMAFADPPFDRIDRLGEFLRGKGMNCSVYAAAVYLDGLYHAGLGADAGRLMAAPSGGHAWTQMIRQGTGATMEAWSLACKGNTTYSHPWAASPAHLLPEGLFGIRPLESGYRTIAVVPQPGDCDDCDVVMPIARGDVSVRWHVRRGIRSGGAGAALIVQSPPNVAVDVVLLPEVRARWSIDISGEGYAVKVDGVVQSVEPLPEWGMIAGVACPPGTLHIAGLPSGRHDMEKCSWTTICPPGDCAPISNVDSVCRGAHMRRIYE